MECMPGEWPAGPFGGVELAQNLYEVMFLIDAAKGGESFPAVIQHISGLLERNGAQIERIERWADNRLAYPIKQLERGIYVLVYCRLDAERVSELRHDIRLSEEILRVLVLRAEEAPPPRGKLFTPQGDEVPQEPEAPAEPESEAAESEAETPAAPGPGSGEAGSNP